MRGPSGFLAMNVFVPLLNGLWQGAAIAALAWIVMRFLPRLNAATRYAIWWAVLGAVLLLPFVPKPELSRSRPNVVQSSTGNTVNPLLPEIEIPAIVHVRPVSPPKWPLAIAALWAAVFFYRLIRIAQSFMYLRRLKARSFASPQLLPLTGRDARLLLSNEVSSPIAVGFRKPAVILPVSLPSDLDKAEFDHVVLHEAGHLARMDDWTNLASRILEAGLALHPVALWILRRIDREREMACDEWVVSRTGHARNYAASLARMYELRWASNEHALAPGIFGRKSCLAERMERLLDRGRQFSGPISARRLVSSIFVLLSLAAAGARAPHWIAFAQPTPRPSFEVASVKPGDPDGRFNVGAQGSLLIANNAPLSILIGFAYDVQLHQILGGPKWINTDRFTIDAKPDITIPAPARSERTNRVRLMLQSLLEERFKLSLHRETRTGQIYELVAAKGGSKLKGTAGPDASGRTGMFGTERPGELTAHSVAVTELVGYLSQRLGSPVIDKTGLAEKYDFKLSFMLEPTKEDSVLFGAPPPGAPPASDSGLPSIFTAVQEQLGLKLESTKGPVEVLVIDRVEKPEPN